MKTKFRTLRAMIIALVIMAAMSVSTFACDYCYDWEDYDYDYADEEEFWVYDDYGWEEFAEEEGYEGYEDGGFVLSYEDLSEYAYIDENEFCFTPIDPIVEMTNATIMVQVDNYSGLPVDSIGCTLYDEYGDVIKSVQMECYCTYDCFTITFDINEFLEEELLPGELYDYRFFVQSDGELYTQYTDCFITEW